MQSAAERSERFMLRRALLFVNPLSGKGKSKKCLLDIIRVFTEAGYSVRVYPTTPSREANIRFVQKNAKYNSLIVAIGGDGTLNELINGVMLSRIGAKIGFIPLGSTNDVAASLGLPQDPVQAARSIVAGKLIPYDVGQFNGEYFGYIAGTGAFTEVSYASSRSLKNALGHLAYVLEGVKNISAIQPLWLKIQTPERTFAGRYLLCTVSNSTSVGGIFRFKRDLVSFNDGLFELVLIKAPKDLIELGILAADLLVSNEKTPLMQILHVSEAIITSPTPLGWTLDGENGGKHRRVYVRNHAGAVKIVKSNGKALDSIR